MARYDLTMVKDYVDEWTVIDAIREILQNAIDIHRTTGNPMYIEYDKEHKKLTIRNDNVVLQPNTLLLGRTTKATQDDTIGKFGEGYKLALLTLTRNNHDVIIENAKKKEIWHASFINSRKWQDTICSVRTSREKIFNHTGVAFVMFDITSEIYDTVKNNTLMLKSDYLSEAYIKTPIGNILKNQDEKGRIYVNGLFVQERDDLRYGYDIKPAYLKIGRDRNLVNNFNVKAICSNMWLSVQDEHKDLIMDMMTANAEDIGFSEYDDIHINIPKAIPVDVQAETDQYDTEKHSYGDNIYDSAEYTHQDLNKNRRRMIEQYYNKLKKQHGLFIPISPFSCDKKDDFAAHVPHIQLPLSVATQMKELDVFQRDYKQILSDGMNTKPKRTCIEILDNYHTLRKNTNLYTDTILAQIDCLVEELYESAISNSDIK